MSSSNPAESFKSFLLTGTAASAAIVFPFRDLVAKSYQQRGLAVPKMTLLEGFRAGCKAAPTVGLIVAAQDSLSQFVDQQWKKMGLVNDPEKFSVLTSFGTPAVVGLATAGPLAVFNGYSNGMTAKASLMQLKGRMGLMLCGAIALQETAFVAGIKARDQINKLSDNPFVVYGAAFACGALGSFAGHPFNTAITLWQKNLSVSPRHFYLGALRKTRAIGCFALLLKLQMDAVNYFARKGNHE